VEEGLGHLLRHIDLVVDATDNYPVRFALNRACMQHRIPMVSAAAVRSEGQLAVFHPALGGPCYRCLYPEAGQATALNCRDSGVLAPVVGVLGSLQAMEAIKVLSGFGEPLYDGLLVMDLRTLSVQRLSLAARAECPDCQPFRARWA
jgi:adenylyltransferase/sulfurtransferase